ncbi:MAG: putative prokaryotic signal transducing protein [Sedimentibacter sp.]|jgi:hypothetical protein|nr:putative prokaryotic signal transducing protein [Sedimentibacter sp.]
MSEEIIDNYKEELLISNLNNIEAEIIMSKLQSYGIPVLKKTKGTGEIMEIYTGVNLYGIDVYVPAHMLDVAKELLKPINEEDNLE